jgi:hypothetical protein
MKPDATILRFKGATLKTSNDIQRALAALMCDLVSGAISPREARPILKELGERMGCVESGMKILRSLA